MSPLALQGLLPLGYLITPALLGVGIAAASAPILIHLLSRRRVRKLEWAAMHWLLAAMKRHQRRLRLENWLILLLRVAALVILGLALARPVLTDSALASLVTGKRSIYLVLDNSYSTEAKLDARSVFERIKHEADLVLKSIGPDDAISVVVTNDPDDAATNGLDPHVLLGRALGTERASSARETLSALRTRHAVAGWAKTLEMVRGQMTEGDFNHQVIIVTDLQARDWLQASRDVLEPSDAPDTARAGGSMDGGKPGTGAASLLRKRLEMLLRQPAKVRLIDVGGTNRRNLAVAAIENRTGQDPFVGRPLRLAVTVANHGASPVVGAELEVTIDDGARKRNYPIPDLPGADTGLRIPKPAFETVHVDLSRTTFQRPGSHTIRVAITPPREDSGADSLGLSSERWLALKVRRRVHVLAWSSTSGSEQDMDAELYLRGIYEGDTRSDDSESAPGGLPPIYAYASVAGEGDLVQRLRTRSEDRPVDLLVLANVAPRDERALKAIREFVNEGGGLLVFTGDSAYPDVLNSSFHTDDPKTRLLPFKLEQREVRRRSTDAVGAFLLDLDFQEDPHPLAEPFTNVKADDWIKRYPPAIWGRTSFREPTPTPQPGDSSDNTAPPAVARDGRVILRFRNEGEGRDAGPAAMVSGRFGEGRTVWVGTSIDNGWLARAGALFLPVFLEEAAMYLTRPADAGHNLEVGDTLHTSIPAAAQQVRIIPPGGGALSPTRRTPESENAARVVYEYDGVGRSGIWQLTYEFATAPGEVKSLREDFAVNPDPNEAALLPASQSAIRDGIPEELDLAFLPSYSDVSSELEDAREGEITRYLLWALIAVLLLESLLALKFGQRSKARDATEV